MLKMKKDDIAVDTDLYVTMYTPKPCKGYILFVHGGPGNHSAYFEQAIQTLSPYNKLPWGWICYDQRGCGRSPLNTDKPMNHHINIKDLEDLYNTLCKMDEIHISAVLGHSYGARLAYELFLNNRGITSKLVMVGRSRKWTTSRQRFLAMHLFLLKSSQPEEYNELLIDIKEKRTDFLSQSNLLISKIKNLKPRSYFFWGNLETKMWYENLKKSVPIEENQDIFLEISNPTNTDFVAPFDFDLRKISQDVLWINGLHDFLMGGELGTETETDITTFMYSGHYPHFEEPERFAKELYVFLEE